MEWSGDSNCRAKVVVMLNVVGGSRFLVARLNRFGTAALAASSSRISGAANRHADNFTSSFNRLCRAAQPATLVMLGCRSGNLFISITKDVTSRKTSSSLIGSFAAFPPNAPSNPAFLLPLVARRHRTDDHLDQRQRDINAQFLRKQKARERIREEKRREENLGNAYRPLSQESIKKLHQTAEDGKWRGRLPEDFTDSGPKEREPWQVQKAALGRKFSSGWNPIKKLSPDAVEGIRALHKQQPETFTTEVLANEFEVSAEAIRRILKSKWKPDEKTAAERKARWEQRGNRIWGLKAEEGVKPPKKWREALGIKLMPKDGTGHRVGLGPGSVPGLSARPDAGQNRQADALQHSTER